MLARTITSGLLVAVLTAASGCYTMPYYAGHAGPPGVGGYYVEDTCGPVGYRGFPLLDRLNYLLTAGSGCGEVYWGEWTNHPPQGCDPCDDHGNWVGHGYAARAPRGPGHMNWVDAHHDPAVQPFQGLRHLWGYRYGAADYPVVYGDEYEIGYAEEYEVVHDSGCSSCSSGMVSMHEGPIAMPPGEVRRSAPAGGSVPPPSGAGSVPTPPAPGSRDAAAPRRLTASPARPVHPSRR